MEKNQEEKKEEVLLIQDSGISKTFDASLCTVLAQYFDLPSLIKMSKLNKGFQLIFGGKSEIDSKVWADQVGREFPYQERYTADHGKIEATHYERFKRVFSVYQRARSIIKRLILAT